MTLEPTSASPSARSQRRASRVPAGRLARWMHLGVMAGGVAAGAAMEGARRLWAGERPALADIVRHGANPGIMLSCEPIFAIGPYDYGATDLASRARDAALALAFERGLVRPPPPEMLFVHRKIGGTYLLCAQLGARVDTAALVRQLAGATPMSTLQ